MELSKQILRKSILLFIFLFFDKLSNAQSCFFSLTGDTVLYVENIYQWNDSSKYNFTFYVKSKQSMLAVQLKSSSKWITSNYYYRTVYDTVKKYGLQDESKELEEDQKKPYQVSYKRNKFKFLERKKGACSKGCWNTLYYFLNLDFIFKSGGEVMYDGKNVDVIYGSSSYDEWGYKPKKVRKPDFDEAIYTEVFEGKDTYFMLISYTKGESMKDPKRGPVQKYFFIDKRK